MGFPDETVGEDRSALPISEAVRDFLMRLLDRIEVSYLSSWVGFPDGTVGEVGEYRRSSPSPSQLVRLLLMF